MQKIILPLKFFLKHAFDIRDGEFSRALLMQVNFFLLISSILIIKPTVNALFISKFGVEKLPVVFILVALTAGVISTVYSRLLKKYSLIKIIVKTLQSSGIALLLFWGLLLFNFLEGWVLFVFYIWSVIFSVLSASQFWILANLVFNPREAKRLFGFIGAGAIAGGIFGGYLTSILAEIISIEHLLIVCSVLLFTSIFVTNKIWTISSISSDTPFKEKKRTSLFTDHPFNLIRNSKHLTYLASIIGISVVVAKLVEYQFSAVAFSKIPDPDELAAFFGFWFSNMNLVSLLVQLFVTRRVVGVFGVGTSLLFLPAGIFVGAVAILFMPELWAVILLRISDGSLKQSVNKAGIELLALPIPSEIKNQTKSFIDVFVDSFATGIGGVILVVFVTGMNFSVRLISLLIILLLVLWFYFIRKVRNEYLNSFKLKFEHNSNNSKKSELDLNNESVVGGLKKILETGGEKQKLYFLKKIKEIQNYELVPVLQKLLQHPSSNIKTEALRNLYFYKNVDLSEQIKPLIEDNNSDLREEAFQYLLAGSSIDKKEFLGDYLSNPNDLVKSSAIFAVAQETRDNPELFREFNVREHIERQLIAVENIEIPEIKKGVLCTMLKAIGTAHINSLYYHINEGLKNKDFEIVKQSMIAAGYSVDPEFLDQLIRLLGEEQYFNIARDAILFYGESVLNVLSHYIDKKDIEIEIKKRIPSVIEKITMQESVDILFEILNHEELILKIEALRSLNNLKKGYPYFNYYDNNVVELIFNEVKLYTETLAVLYKQTTADSEVDEENKITNVAEQHEARKELIKLLERRLDGNLERIFRLLGLKYPPDDIITVFRGIQSNKPELRNSAIEFLDNLLEANLKKVLIPIIEMAVVSTISEEIVKNMKIKIPDEQSCFELLMNGKDVKIKLSVLYLLSVLKDPKYKSILIKYSNSENPKIKSAAQKALDTLSGKKS